MASQFGTPTAWRAADNYAGCTPWNAEDGWPRTARIYALPSFPLTHDTNWNVVYGFNFSVVPGSRIDGVEVTFLASLSQPYRAAVTAAIGSDLMVDTATQKGFFQVFIGDNTFQQCTAGGPTDTWGLGTRLTDEYVNNWQFCVGIVMSIMDAAGTGAMLAAGPTATVYFTPPETTAKAFFARGY